MDRIAVFVDAGFLLASAGRACLATSRRRNFEVDFPSLVRQLAGICSEDSALPTLRIYWYDAAPTGLPLPEHDAIAALADVKVRLGRLTHHGQKGVDSLIIRDLITLARERAIATAYVLGGDADLREGIAAAQEMGLRVVVLGVEGGTRAEALVHEADAHLMLAASFLAPFFHLRSEPRSSSGSLHESSE
jgi:hypothetical protein